MADREETVRKIKELMKAEGISPDELKGSSGGSKPKNGAIKKSRPAPERQRPQRQRPQRRRRSLKNPNANSETRITSNGFFGRQPILGGHRRGIFDSNQPILGKTKRITGRPVVSGDKRPIVGDRGQPVSQGSIIGNQRVIGDGKEISKRIRKK